MVREQKILKSVKLQKGSYARIIVMQQGDKYSFALCKKNIKLKEWNDFCISSNEVFKSETVLGWKVQCDPDMINVGILALDYYNKNNEFGAKYVVTISTDWYKLLVHDYCRLSGISYSDGYFFFDEYMESGQTLIPILNKYGNDLSLDTPEINNVTLQKLLTGQCVSLIATSDGYYNMCAMVSPEPCTQKTILEKWIKVKGQT